MDKTVVYVKQSGEPPVPATARIDWLPHGKIKPLLFWTPGGNCYKVRREYEKQCGPLYSFRSPSGAYWSWIDNPWPWQKQFNDNFCEEK